MTVRGKDPMISQSLTRIPAERSQQKACCSQPDHANQNRTPTRSPKPHRHKKNRRRTDCGFCFCDPAGTTQIFLISLFFNFLQNDFSHWGTVWGTVSIRFLPFGSSGGLLFLAWFPDSEPRFSDQQLPTSVHQSKGQANESAKQGLSVLPGWYCSL